MPIVLILLLRFLGQPVNASIIPMQYFFLYVLFFFLFLMTVSVDLDPPLRYPGNNVGN